MLPPHVLSDLQKPGAKEVLAYRHEMVTILFADVVSFTALAASYETSEVILMLNEMFAEFDRLTVASGVYKVETTGDSYMVAAGHDGLEPHREAMLDLACSMIEAAARIKTPNGDRVQIRIGIHSGTHPSGVSPRP